MSKPLSDYRVRRVEEDDLLPEETLADSTGHASVEMPISGGVFSTFIGILALMLVLLASQSLRLQVLVGEQLAARADQSRFNRYPVPGLRGVITDRDGVPLVQNVPTFDLVAVRSELERVDDDAPNQAIFVVQRDMSKEEAIRYQAAALPGLYVVASARRHYLTGPAFAHVLGYTSEVNEKELTADPSLRLGDRIGRLGIEQRYDTFLRGESGSVPLTRDSIAPNLTHGSDLALELDADAQERLYTVMQQVFRSAGVTRGAAIVQDVRTGGVLGIVSFPTFDPNWFETGDDRIREVLEARQRPLFNRAIGGLYAPGSTIKPLYAMIGLKEGVVTPSTLIYADGAIEVQSEVDPSSYYTFRDWKVHGWTDIRKAIANSVDVFFYALGGGYENIHGVGIDTLEKYLKLARADQPTGIDLPAEAKGFVPSRAWKKKIKNDSWYVGDTYNVAIGQGDLLVTPMWLSAYVGAIANGGKLIQPHVARAKPEVVATLPFDEITMRVVREGMRQTVTDGTAQLLKDLPKPVAAKTGTAQVTGRGLNSLFIVYGPYDDPEISVTVLVEQIPESQSLAVRIAHDFFMWYFK